MTKPQAIKTKAGVLNWVTFNGDGVTTLSGAQKYQATLVFPDDSAECKELKAQIDTYWKENKPAGFKKKPKSTGYRAEMQKVLDDDGKEQLNEDGEVIYAPTGNTAFTFSTSTTYPSGDAKIVSIFNAKGNKVDIGSKKIGNGSVGNIGGAMGIYAVRSKQNTITDAGVTLYLNSIRILKFVEFTLDENWEEEEGWVGETEDWEDEPADGDEATKVRL